MSRNFPAPLELIRASTERLYDALVRVNDGSLDQNSKEQARGELRLALQEYGLVVPKHIIASNVEYLGEQARKLIDSI